jgi:hypothetical protein
MEDLARDAGTLPANAMTRAQLEHLIRAAAVIADDDTIVIVGSQSVLGQFPNEGTGNLTRRRRAAPIETRSEGIDSMPQVASSLSLSPRHPQGTGGRPSRSSLALRTLG